MGTEGARSDAGPLDAGWLDLAILDQPPQPPEYLVDGLLERQAALLLAGDAGTGKTILALDLAVALVTGRPWLGRTTHQARVLYIDGESSERLAADRLRALGLGSHDATALRLGIRQGLTLEDGREQLRTAAVQHRADVLILDPIMALTRTDVNDNTGVARLFDTILRPLITSLDLALVLVHHERKPSGGGYRDAAHATLGASYWRGGVDMQLVLEASSDSPEPQRRGDVVREITAVTMRRGKVRDGTGNARDGEVLQIESERQLDHTLRTLQVRSRGVKTRSGQRQTTAEGRNTKITGALANADQPLTQAEVARAAGLVDKTGKASSHMGDWLEQLRAADRIVRTDDGRWTVPAQD
jgi:hypothetical protein